MNISNILDKIVYEEAIRKFCSENKIKIVKNDEYYPEFCYHSVSGGYYTIFNGNIDLKQFLKHSSAKEFIDKFILKGLTIKYYPLTYKGKIYMIGFTDSYYDLVCVFLKIYPDNSFSVDTMPKHSFDRLLKFNSIVPDSVYQIMLQEQKAI